MTIQTDQLGYKGANGQYSAADITYCQENLSGRLVLFLHGFKSFKDWGCWPWLAREIATHGHIVLKMNFSHNGVGTTEANMQQFVDLDAFGNNNFSKQLEDISCFLQQIFLSNHHAINPSKLNAITCIGHSMGGGLAILAAAHTSTITKLITLNSMNDFGSLLTRFNEKEWRRVGLVLIDNVRTKQKMPLYYQLYEDYLANGHALNIIANSSKITVPWLWIYSAEDETVPAKSLADILHVCPRLTTKCIENTGHAFDATHPFSAPSTALQEVASTISTFLSN
jgi:uncharacterized protein